MKFFNFIKKNKKYGGIVAALKAEKFWDRFSSEERLFLREEYAKFKRGTDPDFTADMVDSTAYRFKDAETTIPDFLFTLGRRSFASKNYPLAENILLQAAEYAKSPEAKNSILNELIDVYYKQREIREDAIEKCKEYCRKSIELFPKMNKEQAEKVETESFKRLAIILEREENYKEAIQVSELAMMYGLSDGTKSGFEGRISKLRKKAR